MQVDVHFHHECTKAFALYPMVAVQAALYSDTEEVQREGNWNDDKLSRERDLYDGCVRRKTVEAAMKLSSGAADGGGGPSISELGLALAQAGATSPATRAGNQ